MSDYETYLSPFSWRYASHEMRSIWSEAHRRRLWREIWVKLATAQSEMGLVRPDQVADLQSHAAQVDLPRALEIEAEIHHDLMAEIRTFAEQASVGGGIIHLGATSMDIEDNADVLRMREALRLLLTRLDELLLAFARVIYLWADLPVIAFTHLQPAEPTTLGYRLAIYAQDLLEDRRLLIDVTTTLRGKGFKGAVGTGASYMELVGAENYPAFEARMADLLNLIFYPATTQTYPRKQDYRVISGLAGLAATLYRFAFDLRLLQSPVIGEVGEPFGQHQVGSSAMPFKRNPIQSEKIDSLARSIAQMPATAWANAAHTLLERTLDDNANRRSLLPEACLACEELVLTATKIITGLDVREEAAAANLATYAPFAATERLLMALVKAGADRQQIHERLREHSLAAWQAVQQGKLNPLNDLLAADELIRSLLPAEILHEMMDASSYLGIAPGQARAIAGEIEQTIL